jgi:formiminoglutamase
VPPEAQPFCRLTLAEIVADGDEGAGEIYDLGDHTRAWVTTDVARAIVDLNRAVTDRRPDGVVKTQTCWGVPVYHEPLPEPVVGQLLDRYYHPYRRRLSHEVPPDVRLCVDCHTMAAAGPPIGPDPGRPRPHVCLGNGDPDGRGTPTLPRAWMGPLMDSFQAVFGDQVTWNDPFSGGHITLTHGRERPWLQLELSRAPFLSAAEKRRGVLQALADFCRRVLV